VVVNNFYVFGTVIRPFEADTPLPVDAYAELAGPVPTQCFKTIARQRNQLIGRFHRIQNFQTLFSLSAETLKSSNRFASCECFGSFIPITLDHGTQGY